MLREIQGKPRRAVLVAVQLPATSDAEHQASLAELGHLARTLGWQTVATFSQKRAALDPGAYLGRGKREELRAWIQPAEDGERACDLVLVDDDISPSQARNLEKETGCEVLDRTGVILEIFHRHARSRAAKAQVEIVRLKYLAPRMREQRKLEGPKGRQRSGTGGRGAGESHLELDRRKLRDRIAELSEELEALEAERRTQRARRQGLVARVALVGYTNAGKSTLMKALTRSDVLVADKLFATLDTTVRTLQPPSIPQVLVSDTVGFIKNLPHGLVASLRSTLEDALEAGLLLHVVDAADPGYERQIAVTEQVLAEIGAGAIPRIHVFNKMDKVGDEAAHEAVWRARWPDAFAMSARRSEDVARLREAIVAHFRRGFVEAELVLPWDRQAVRGEVFEHCEVLEEQPGAEATISRVRGLPGDVERLKAVLAWKGAP